MFPDGKFSQERLDAVLKALGNDKSKLVIDLSCRKTGEQTWHVAMNKWQKITDMEVNQGRPATPRVDPNIPSNPTIHYPSRGHILTRLAESIKSLEPYCSEFLIHAADNEGLQKGVDEELVKGLAEWCSIPVTYAGGARHLEDLELVKRLSGGKVDLTIGSALDCFGGDGVKFDDCVAWNRRQ